MGLGYFIIWIISKTKYNTDLRKYFWMFVIGMVAPDIERFFRLVAQALDSQTLLAISFKFTTITHSILGAVIISLFITSFFPHEKDIKFVFLAIFIGAIGHLILDMIMFPWPGMGINLFYPLAGSDFAYSFHLVWPGGFVPLIITGCLLMGTVFVDLIQRNFTVFNLKLKNYNRT